MSSVVAKTSAFGTANQHSSQRKDFYSKGLFWKFYSDGTNMVYKTSSDNETWSDAIDIRASIVGSAFSIWFDGTYLHYAYAHASSIFYRRGEPEIGGTIDWSAAEQTVTTIYDTAFWPFVSVDTSGHAWVGYSDRDSGIYYPYVIMSDNTDGTWAGAEVPYLLSTGSHVVSIIPLTVDKMLALYAWDGRSVKARYWNGTVWATQVYATAITYRSGYSAVALGDAVHLVYQGTSSLKYAKWTYNSFSVGVLQPFAVSGPVICISGSDLYIFWTNHPMAGHIYYMKYDAGKGQWLDGVDWINELPETPRNLTCFYQQRYGYIGLAYATGTSSPYNLKFNYFTTDPYDPDPGSPAEEPDVTQPPPKLEPEPTKKLDVSINASGSRHVYKPSQGHRQRTKRGRITRHITWVPVSIVRA